MPDKRHKSRQEGPKGAETRRLLLEKDAELVLSQGIAICNHPISNLAGLSKSVFTYTRIGSSRQGFMAPCRCATPPPVISSAPGTPERRPRPLFTRIRFRHDQMPQFPIKSPARRIVLGANNNAFNPII